MDRSLKMEIENEYKTQINELEENLEQIGEFEASVKPAVGLKMLYAVINYIFSTALMLGVVVILLTVFAFFSKFLGMVETWLDLTEGILLENMGQVKVTPAEILRLSLLVIGGFFILTSTLLQSIRRKNQTIINIGIIASDFKVRSVNMLDVTKERFKNFSKVVANDNRI